MIELYAIRQKGTNKYLPELSKGRRRGHSFQVPVEVIQQMPRLFLSDWSAVCALRAWVRGEVHCKRYSGYSYGGEWDYDETLSLVPKPDRRIEDMEIVIFQLHEMKAFEVPCSQTIPDSLLNVVNIRSS